MSHVDVDPRMEFRSIFSLRNLLPPSPQIDPIRLIVDAKKIKSKYDRMTIGSSLPINNLAFHYYISHTISSYLDHICCAVNYVCAIKIHYVIHEIAIYNIFVIIITADCCYY